MKNLIYTIGYLNLNMLLYREVRSESSESVQSTEKTSEQIDDKAYRAIDAKEQASIMDALNEGAQTGRRSAEGVMVAEDNEDMMSDDVARGYMGSVGTLRDSSEGAKNSLRIIQETGFGREKNLEKSNDTYPNASEPKEFTMDDYFNADKNRSKMLRKKPKIEPSMMDNIKKRISSIVDFFTPNSKPPKNPPVKSGGIWSRPSDLVKKKK